MFALTMAGDDKRDDQLQDMQTRVHGATTNIQTIHTWLDSMSTSSNECFDQIKLTQTSTQTTVNAVVERLDALRTTIRGLQKDSHGHVHHVPRHSGNDSFAKPKFKIPPYNGKYNPTVYLDWELEVEQQFSYYDISANSQVPIAISEFTDLALMWWRDYKQRHPTIIPTTWDQLKAAMRHRFVTSYYARDWLIKLQRFQQGSQSVDVYYQELQKGMLYCGLIEENDAVMARFHGGLNCEIHDILDHKEYADMTTLFKYACQAERDVHDVQGCCSKQYSNTFAGQCSTSSSAPTLPAPSTPTTTVLERPAPSTPTTTLLERMAEPSGASSCANSEPSLHNAPNTPSENIGNVHGATLTEGENCVNVLNLSTNHSLVERLIVNHLLIYLCHMVICLMFLVIKMNCVLLLQFYTLVPKRTMLCMLLKKVMRYNCCLLYIIVSNRELLHILICHGCQNIHTMLLANITTRDNIWYIRFTFVQI
jgi:hypothetical protein